LIRTRRGGERNGRSSTSAPRSDTSLHSRPPGRGSAWTGGRGGSAVDSRTDVLAGMPYEALDIAERTEFLALLESAFAA
jgi:hypothetical protein